MGSGHQSAVFNAFHGIFEQNRKLLKDSTGKTKLPKVANRELELAVVVILVDLASADSNFDSREFMTICIGMQRLFGVTQPEVMKLIAQANQVLASLRGVDRFANLLREEVPIEKRKQIMEVVQNVIAADGREDDFEIYLRHKFHHLLGLNEQPAAQVEAAAPEE
jgi:uncharacterized tellurite resistance protein B-like protein